jgi:hypothetical protein
MIQVIITTKKASTTTALLKPWLDGRVFGSSNSNRRHIQRDLMLLSIYFYLQLLNFNLALVIG